ncbi:hypothetical protein Tco_0957301 [Tanacetum coccineum]
MLTNPVGALRFITEMAVMKCCQFQWELQDSIPCARHFRAKVHYLREVIEFGDVKLEKVHTDDNLADPFTKALAFPKHSEHTKNIGMLPASSLIDKSTPSAISESKMWRKKEEAEGDGDDEDGIKGSFFA